MSASSDGGRAIDEPDRVGSQHAPRSGQPRGKEWRIRTRPLLGNGNLLYLVQRGRLDAFGADLEGYTALILIDCPGDRRTRMGIWSGPDPFAGESGSSPERQDPAALVGSPADEQAIREFMAGFELCPSF